MMFTITTSHTEFSSSYTVRDPEGRIVAVYSTCEHGWEAQALAQNNCDFHNYMAAY